MAKKNKWLLPLLAILTLVGGAEHLFASYGWFSILGLFPATWASIVQLIAGAATIWFAVGVWMKKFK